MVKKDNAIPQRKKEQVKKLVEGAGMGLGFFIMFASLSYREEVAAVLDVVLGPLATFNKHKLKKIEKKRAEVMRKQTQFSGEMMRQQMKPMAYIGIITIPIFMWIWIYVKRYSSGVVIFPLIGATALSDVFIFSFPFWVLWYMICSIPITQVIRKLLGIRSGM